MLAVIVPLKGQLSNWMVTHHARRSTHAPHHATIFRRSRARLDYSARV